MKAYQIKIELVGSKPLIWRRIIIPSDVTFNYLHNIIQYSMGWLDYHLFEFEIKKENLRITNNDEAVDEYRYYEKKYKNKNIDVLIKLKPENNELIVAKAILKTTVKSPLRIKIDTYLEKYKYINYVYDFGDYWQHKIKLEKIVDDYEFGYATIIDGDGTCPPEDVGGIDGYNRFLKAWNDPNDPEHEETRVWGESQHYIPFNIKFFNDALKICCAPKKVK